MPRPSRKVSVRGGIQDPNMLANLRDIIEELNNATEMIEELKKEIVALKGKAQ